MRTTELYLDPADHSLVHASPTCEHNLGLTDLAQGTSAGIDDLDELLAIVGELGLAVPIWSVRGARHCPHCTLVATTQWAVAA